MAKKSDEEIKPDQSTEKQEIKAKVEEKVEAAEKKVEKATGERVNLIGELATPEPETKEEFKTWAKTLNAKLDELISAINGKKEPEKEVKKEESVPTPETKKVSWFDKELF